MLNSLDALVITFFGMSILALIWLIIQFIAKNKRLQRISFYCASVLGVMLSIFNCWSTPLTGPFIGEIVAGFALAVPAAAAVILQLVRKDEKTFMIAKILTSLSVVGGMLSAFII